MGTKTIVRNVPGHSGRRARVMVKHSGIYDENSPDADLMIERLSEPDGDVLTSLRLPPGEHYVFNVGMTISLRITQVPPLTPGKK